MAILQKDKKLKHLSGTNDYNLRITNNLYIINYYNID